MRLVPVSEDPDSFAGLEVNTGAGVSNTKKGSSPLALFVLPAVATAIVYKLVFD